MVIRSTFEFRNGKQFVAGAVVDVGGGGGGGEVITDK